MKAIEKLPIITALEKLVKTTKTDVRKECDDELYGQYAVDGIKKKELRLDGQKVGDFIVTMHKPEFVISDKEKFDEFALANGFGVIKKSIDPWMMDRAIEILESHISEEEIHEYIQEEVIYNNDWQKWLEWLDGEIVIEGTKHIVPGVMYKPEAPKSTMVKGCDPKDVFPIVKRIGGIDQLLLGDSNE